MSEQHADNCFGLSPKKMWMCIVVVLLLVILFHRCGVTERLKEKYYATNWAGEPGALSIRPADKVLVSM